MRLIYENVVKIKQFKLFNTIMQHLQFSFSRSVISTTTSYSCNSSFLKMTNGTIRTYFVDFLVFLSNETEILAKWFTSSNGAKEQWKIWVMANAWVSAHVWSAVMDLYEPRCEKNGFLHMRKQRRRSASR